VAGHTLIIGGTGMLADFSASIAEREGALTSIARTERSLTSLERRLSKSRCTHRTLALDYNDARSFARGLRLAVEAAGPIDLVVGWFHHDAVAVRLASELGAMGHPSRFVHVMGSAAGDPAADCDRLHQQVEAEGPITYQQVVLGFVRENGRSRWLTNLEISEGVGRAVELGQPFSVVGTTSPWDERP